MKVKDLTPGQKYFLIDIKHLNIYEIEHIFEPIEVEYIRSSSNGRKYIFKHVDKFSKITGYCIYDQVVFHYVFDNLEEAKKKELWACKELKTEIDKKIDNLNRGV